MLSGFFSLWLKGFLLRGRGELLRELQAFGGITILVNKFGKYICEL